MEEPTFFWYFLVCYEIICILYVTNHQIIIIMTEFSMLVVHAPAAAAAKQLAERGSTCLLLLYITHYSQRSKVVKI